MPMRWMRRSAAVFAAAAFAVPARAQTPSKKVLVLDFDQTRVQANFHDIFGTANVNVGRSIAQFLANRLGAQVGLEAVQSTGSMPFTMDPSAAAAAGRASHADAVIAGSIIIYGSASGTAGVGVGPRLGGMRLNVGRRTTIVAVQLEARVIDVASGQLLGVLPASAQGSRSGLAIGVEVGRLIDASGFIDMTRDEFRHTAIGEFTDSTVSQLSVGLEGMRDRIGNVAPPVTPVAAPAAMAPPAGPPVAAGPPGPVGPVVYPSGPFAYAPWQFKGTEHFHYTVSAVESNGQPQSGFYTLDLAPVGGGAVRMNVAGQLGTDSWSNTVTIQPNQAQGPGAFMTFAPLMGMGPLGATLFSPASVMMFQGHQLTMGDGWSNSSRGQTMSMKVEAQCSYGGQGGLNLVTRHNDQVVMETCVAPDVALPLRSLVQGDHGERFELVLTEYHP